MQRSSEETKGYVCKKRCWLCNIRHGRHIIDDNEGFSAPFHYIYKIEDGLIKQYIYIHISNAFNSTNVEEINNGTWDNWTKLRYLNSCLDKKDIFFIHLTSDYDEYLGYIDFREPTAELIHKILYHLGSNLGTHRFYKFD